MPEKWAFGLRLYWQIYDSIRREFYGYIRRECEAGRSLKTRRIVEQWRIFTERFEVDGGIPSALKGLLFEILYYSTRYEDVMSNEKKVFFFPIMETASREYDFMELRVIKGGFRDPRFIEVKSKSPDKKNSALFEQEALHLRTQFGVGITVAFPKKRDSYPDDYGDWGFIQFPKKHSDRTG